MLGHPQRREEAIRKGGRPWRQRGDGRVEDIWRGRAGWSPVRVNRGACRCRGLGRIGFARRKLIGLEYMVTD
jgi:hypothetical protein